jgi:3-methyladenine DNA glycosylase AlkD
VITAAQVLGELETLGSAQTRKTYKRHGVGENVYGVSYADLKKLTKKLKIDHGIAQALWVSGNHDARILAMMIADPEQADNALLDRWARDLDNYVVTDAFAGYAGKTRLTREKMEQWTRSDLEWIGAAGWNLLGQLAMNDQTLPDDYFEKYLGLIERDIHGSKNRVRHAMNMALIAIGLRNAALERRAMTAAQRIGKVIVDHGETNCKTPDAAAYIKKARERKKMSVPASAN